MPIARDTGVRRDRRGDRQLHERSHIVDHVGFPHHNVQVQAMRSTLKRCGILTQVIEYEESIDERVGRWHRRSGSRLSSGETRSKFESHETRINMLNVPKWIRDVSTAPPLPSTIRTTFCVGHEGSLSGDTAGGGGEMWKGNSSVLLGSHQWCRPAKGLDKMRKLSQAMPFERILSSSWWLLRRMILKDELMWVKSPTCPWIHGSLDVDQPLVSPASPISVPRKGWGRSGMTRVPPNCALRSSGIPGGFNRSSR